MKILTLGMGAFGFAINKLLGENNPNKTFYAFELNKEVVVKLKKDREHPFFFEGYKIPTNIEILDSYDDIISEIDLLIIAIPAQFVFMALDGFDKKLKEGVTIMNLAKGIDINLNKSISQILEEKFKGFDYNYSVLSGGMIALDVVKGKQLGADLGIENFDKGNKIKSLFEGSSLEIKLRKEYLNIELYGSLKNIMAILVGYYEGKGNSYSSIGYYISNLYTEISILVSLYGGNKELDFSYYSLGGDIIATCFGNSRNRYLGQLLGSGKNISESLDILKSEKKHAEGYETLKAVYKVVKNKEGFTNIKFLYRLIDEK